MKYMMIILVISALFFGCGNDNSDSTGDESLPTVTPSSGVIGQWIDGDVHKSSIITLYQNNAGIWFQEEFADDTPPYISTIEEVATENKKTRRFDEINGSGKYYVIDSNNDLLLFDSEGQIRDLSPR